MDYRKYLYLFKDVLQLTSIKYTVKIRHLLRLLAFQVGQQVSGLQPQSGK